MYVKLSKSTTINRQQKQSHKFNDELIQYDNDGFGKISSENVMTIQLGKNDQLEPSFMDTFSKFISNPGNLDLYGCYNDIKVTSYSQFCQTIKNLKNQMNRSKPFRQYTERFKSVGQERLGFKKTKSYENVRKESGDSFSSPPSKLVQRGENKYIFNFQACNNSIILLLDLSSYMMLFDYSTKSFLLQNMEQIVKDLFIGLEHHEKERKSPQFSPRYFISCYAFSVYSAEIQEVMKNQQIFFPGSHQSKFKNRDLISDYICAYINRSKLPSIQKTNGMAVNSISKIIQKVLNFQQGHSGIKSFVTISAFKEIETNPFIFFSSNWYTFCFICPGELNFGSYIINHSQISNRLSNNPFFETKFVYTCRFLENWEKVQLIEQQGFEFKYLDSSVQKGRAILYIHCNSNGNVPNKSLKKESIFEDILTFRLKIDERRRKQQTTLKSNDSLAIHQVQKNYKQFGPFEFTVPSQHINEIMRTKYLQGWQQIFQQKYIPNTKYQFKLQFPNKTSINYDATRKQDFFNIKIYYNLPESQSHQNFVSQISKQERRQIAETIKKIDIVNTSSLDIVTSFKNSQHSKTQTCPTPISGKPIARAQNRDKINTYNFCFNLDSRSSQGWNINELLLKHQEWNYYFKVRKIYIEFVHNNNFLMDLNQLLNQFGFLLGERISQLCFMQRKEKKEKVFDNIKEKQVSIWNVIFVKVKSIRRFLEFKFGFLKFNDRQIQQIIENIENKLTSKKLMNGSIRIIPGDIYNYCTQEFDNSKSITHKYLPNVFHKVWKIGFKNEQLSYVFCYMNNKVIKKLGYKLLYSKSRVNYYFKVISFSDKKAKKQKSIFLQTTYNSFNNIEFKLQTFPCFDFIQNLINKQKQKDDGGAGGGAADRNGKEVFGSFGADVKEVPKVGGHYQISQSSQRNSSFLELFGLVTDEIKESQRRLINLIKTYTQIYEILLKKRLEEKNSGIESQELKEKIKQIYELSTQNFESDYLSLLQKIKKQNYNEQLPLDQAKTSNLRRPPKSQSSTLSPSFPQINIDQIPQPRQHLTESPITSIKGDLTLTSKNYPQKSYTFFLLTPHKVVYLSKKPSSKRIYFRCLQNIYSHKEVRIKEENKLKEIVEREVVHRINKQLLEENYMRFYGIVADCCMMNSPTKGDTGKEIGRRKIDTSQSVKAVVEKSQEIISSFVGVSLNFEEVFKIINKEENQMLQSRMHRVLTLFKQKFFEYISLFYEQSKIELSDEPEIQFDLDQLKTTRAETTDTCKQSSKQAKLKIMRTNSSKNSDNDPVPLRKQLNSYFYEKRQTFSEQNLPTLLNSKNFNEFNTFDSSILKLCTDTDISINSENLIQLFVNRSQNGSTPFTCILIKVFGYRMNKNSSKIVWLQEILDQLLTECIIFLNLATVIDHNDIKQMENKLSEHIVRKSTVKVPDQIWNEAVICRQIQSGSMRSIIPFYQYSVKPSPQKFIAREIEAVPASFTPINKPNQIFNLKYWLTIELTPARVLKIRAIPFKHIALSTEFIANKQKQDYDTQMQELVNFYISQLFKFLKIRNFFNYVEMNLKFPPDPPIPIFINHKISRKLEEEKKRARSSKVPKKFMKQQSQVDPASSMNDQNSTAKSLFKTPLIYEEIPTAKGMFRMPLIYQEQIRYFAKFEPQDFLEALASSQKLNIAAIRNLPNTYIFFNYELKEHFIFYLEDCSVDVTEQCQRTKSTTFDGSQKLLPPQDPSKKSKPNILSYSVYCIDKTVSKQQIEKLHGGLIRKAIEEVTFLKVSEIVYFNPGAIDQPQEKYFREYYDMYSKNKPQNLNFTFSIPHIGNKSNLRQYLKQHLQSTFYHKRTEFKSSKTPQKIQQQSYSSEQEEVDFKTKTKISTKRVRRRRKADFNQCQKKCVPVMWVFNTYNARTLEHFFGNCIILLKITINDTVPGAENAMIWQRNTKQNIENRYIYPFFGCNDPKCQNNQDSLFGEKFLENYLLEYPQREKKQKKNNFDGKNDANTFFVNSNAFGHSSFTFPGSGLQNSGEQNGKSIDNVKGSFNLQNVFDVSLEKHSSEIFQFQTPDILTTISFEIEGFLGNPRLQNFLYFYKVFTYESIYDYYIENRLFRELFCNFHLSNSVNRNKNLLNVTKLKSLTNQHDQSQTLSQMTDTQCQSNPPAPSKLCKNESSPNIFNCGNNHYGSIFGEGSKKGFRVHPIEQETQIIYEQFLQLFKILQKQFPLKNTECVFNYKNINKILIQNKVVVLNDFVFKLSNMFAVAAKNIENYALRLVIYGIDKAQNSPYFWCFQLQKTAENPELLLKNFFDHIQCDIGKYKLQLERIGVFFYDSLYDIDSLKETFLLKEKDSEKQGERTHGRYWQTSNRTDIKVNTNFDWLKKYQQHVSFCQTPNYFANRSLLLHFEVQQSQLTYYSYNLEQKYIPQLTKYLQELELWFAQKNRMFNFIFKIKQSSLSSDQRQSLSEHEIPNTPEINVPKSTEPKQLYDNIQNQDSPSNKLKQKPTVAQPKTEPNLSKLLMSIIFDELPFKRFIQERKNIEKLYKVLSKQHPPYASYPPFKPKQGGRLFRLGKEYLSILRHYYGFDRARKDSHRDKDLRDNRDNRQGREGYRKEFQAQ